MFPSKSENQSISNSPAESKLPDRRLLSRSEASRYLLQSFGVSRSPKTLAKLAVIGGGPSFRKAGRAVLYHPEDLDQWVDRILSPKFTSTGQRA